MYPGRGGAIDPFTLEGRYVRLEPLTPAHVPALVAAASVDRGHYGLAFVPEGEVAMRAWVEVALGEQRAGRAVPFATVERATGRVLGSTRFGNIDRWTWPPGSPMQRPEGTPDVVEIGWTWLTADGAAERRQHRREAGDADPRVRGVAGAAGEPDDRQPERAVAGRRSSGWGRASTGCCGRPGWRTTGRCGTRRRIRLRRGGVAGGEGGAGGQIALGPPEWGDGSEGFPRRFPY